MLFYLTFIKECFLMAFFILLCFNLNAQNLLIDANGKQTEVDTFYISDGLLYYSTPTGKQKKTSTLNVYMIQPENGNPIRFVYGDTTTLELTKNQYIDYLCGLEEGKLKFSESKVTKGAFVCGAASPFLAAQITMPVFAPLIPLAYLGAVGASGDKRIIASIPQQYADNAYYKAGYIISARKKRINRSILWAGIGLVAAYTAAIIRN